MRKLMLINFEKKIAERFDNGEIPYLIHLSGGNEDALIEIFKKIKKDDYVFSTHRNHYHYLLHGGNPQHLEHLIMTGCSMFVFDRGRNFYSSSIVAGSVGIAAGVAFALKRKGSNRKVWCFVGDGAEDEGHFYEAVRYVDGWQLPCMFVIEDNDRSVNASKQERWGKVSNNMWPPCVVRYSYTPTWLHGGTGGNKWLKFSREAKVCTPPQKRKLNNIGVSIVVNNNDHTTYKNAVKIAMEMLADTIGAIFIGYNVRYGSAYGTLSGVPGSQCIETPVSENLMAGLAMGMSLEGFRPVLFFERHDFIFNALDALVNQLDKIEVLSNGEYKFPIIIKAVAGSVKPFYAGLTHTANLTALFQQLFSFPVCEPQTPEEVLDVYRSAMYCDYPVLVSERKELYEQ